MVDLITGNTEELKKQLYQKIKKEDKLCLSEEEENSKQNGENANRWH